jgi:ribose 5-phosphate isomerase A
LGFNFSENSMTIIERALQLLPPNAVIGLGSGHAAHAFVRALAERIRQAGLQVRGVPTSNDTAALAGELGVPLAGLADIEELDMTFDGADEVAPNLDLIEGYGRALVREKIVASSSRQLVILVGQEKLVPQLGARGKLPIEVNPFARPLCERRLTKLGLKPTLWAQDGRPLTTDNGNFILDCEVAAIANPAQLESELRSIPGVVGTGLFLGMASVVLVGHDTTFELVEERRTAKR